MEYKGWRPLNLKIYQKKHLNRIFNYEKHIGHSNTSWTLIQGTEFQSLDQIMELSRESFNAEIM